jgi:hypothetical protein
MALLQAIIERCDPINLGRRVAAEPLTAIAGGASKHVLFQEVIDDGFVPNPSNEDLGRALGLAHVRPVVREVFGLAPVDEPVSLNHPQGVTTAFFQFDWLADGEPASHTDIYADTVAQTQWIHFFETYLATGVPEVIDPYRVLGIERSLP